MSKPKRILIVDDEQANLTLMRDMLKALGYESETAVDGYEALSKLSEKIDLVLMDVMMPKLDGFETVRWIRQDPDFKDIPIIMVTALSDMDSRLKAVKAGADDFISKPVDNTELKIRTASLLEIKEARDAIKEYQEELENKVEERTAQLQEALQEVTEAHLDSIMRLSIAAEFKDEDTAEHIQRMSHYSALLAEKLGLSSNDVETVLHTSSMHDIGKIGTPDAILLKPDKLNAEEWKIMQEHTVNGGRILSDSKSKLLQAGEVIALSHHEKWNGSGYPNGLGGEDIPIFGRICAVADVFDALTSKRPYKEPFSNEKSLIIMKEGRGKHFDPKILDLFVENFDKVLEIKNEFRAEKGYRHVVPMGLKPVVTKPTPCL